MHNHFHFYQVFNPMINEGENYKTQAHEFYAQLKSSVKNQLFEQSFMYWGKLKVNGQSDQNVEAYQAIIEKNKLNGLDTHLYITDFHHFWVAKVESVHNEIFNKEKTLSFYDNKQVAMWFKITDMDLISAEFEETLYYLSQLYVNNKYHTDKIDSMSPYIGNLNFPVIVQDHSNEHYFQSLHQEDTLRLTRSNPLIDHSNHIDRIQSHMKSFVLSPQVFSKLSHNTKKELLNVEISLAKKNFDDDHLAHATLDSYLRILESVLNETLGKMLKDQYGESLFINETTLLNDFKGNLTLDMFVDFFHHQKGYGNFSFQLLASSFPEASEYFNKDLMAFLDSFEIVSKRKAIQEGQRLSVDKQNIIKIRNHILGVGQVGVINNLIQMLFEYEDNNFMQKAS